MILIGNGKHVTCPNISALDTHSMPWARIKWQAKKKSVVPSTSELGTISELGENETWIIRQNCMAKFIGVVIAVCYFPASIKPLTKHTTLSTNTLSSLTATLATNRQHYVQTTELISALTTSQPWLRKNKLSLHIFRQQQSLAVTRWVHKVWSNWPHVFLQFIRFSSHYESNQHQNYNITGTCSSNLIKIERKKPVIFLKSQCQYSLIDSR
jgi:hypothetical protein